MPLQTPLLASLDQLDEFDSIIDVRSPAEFEKDHIPGAINCPVLDDAQRAQIGTLYSQVSPFDARKLGSILVARNIARHIESDFLDKPRAWRPLIYCWRGGQRSGAMTLVMDQIGWNAKQLAGGYKVFRRRVLDDLVSLSQPLRFEILSGPTGSGKTELLKALAASGEQVLDLEALARHKGSVLGEDPVSEQPSQTSFETALWASLRRFDPSRVVWAESESRRIGVLGLPAALIETLSRARCHALSVPLSVRIEFLLGDYASLLANPQGFKEKLRRLTRLHGREVIESWCARVDAGNWSELAHELITTHYDPAYRRASGSFYLHAAQAQIVALHSLDAASLAQTAARLAAQVPRP